MSGHVGEQRSMAATSNGKSTKCDAAYGVNRCDVNIRNEGQKIKGCQTGNGQKIFIYIFIF